MTCTITTPDSFEAQIGLPEGVFACNIHQAYIWQQYVSEFSHQVGNSIEKKTIPGIE